MSHNVVLRYLRRLDEKVDRLAEDLRDIKQRLNHVEFGVANIQVVVAEQPGRMDKFDTEWEEARGLQTNERADREAQELLQLIGQLGGGSWSRPSYLDRLAFVQRAQLSYADGR